EEFQERQAEALRELQEKAREQNLALLRTPAGLVFAPVRDGEVMPPDEFQKLSQEEQDRIQNIVEELQGQLQRAMMQMPRWEREARRQLRELNDEVSGYVVNDLIDDLLEKYKDLPDVISFLKAVQQDVGEHLTDFLSEGEEGAQPRMPALPMQAQGSPTL